MMSTLFIGTQDYIFHWHDHLQLISGLALGGLFATVVLLMVVVPQKNRYSIVEMNEVKSKVVD